MKRQCPFDAATPFEQKVLNWIFYPLLPLSVIAPKRNQTFFGSKAGVRVFQISFLFIFMLYIYILLPHWDYLILDIRYFINNRHNVVHVPITPVSVFSRWILLVYSVFAVGFILIMSRVKNLPLEIRIFIFCQVGWVFVILDPIKYFAIPAPVLLWLGEITLGLVLVSIGSLPFLLCAVRAKKFLELVQSWELQRVESGEAGKTDPQ